MAALFLFGYDLWPAVLLGAFCVNLLHGAHVPLAFLIAFGNTLEAVAGSYLLRILRFNNSLTRIRDVFSLFIVAIVSTTLSATIGTGCLLLLTRISLSACMQTWNIWWTGDMLSDFIVAPVLLVWMKNSVSLERSWQRWVEGLALLFFLAALSHFVFGHPYDPEYEKLAMPYLIFPPLIWASLRFGPRGAVIATLLAAAFSLSPTLHGMGPFGFHVTDDPLFALQLFMGVMSATALVFAALAAERAESRDALRKSHENLEQRVETRTQEMVAANALLKESEERMRLLVDGVEDYAIFGLDATGHVVTWNSGAERSKGYRAAEILGRHFSCFYTPEDNHKGKPAEMLYLAASEGRIRDEGWRVRKDGSLYIADVLITALRDKAGVLKGFTKITRDITERKQMDERFQKSQDQLTEAQRIAHIGNWEWDLEQNTLFWSDELYRIYGLPVQGVALRYADIMRYIHRDDRRIVKNTLRSALHSFQAFTADFRIHRSVREERFLRAFGNVIVDSNGKPVRVVGTAQDITAQKQSEHALQQKDQELYQGRKLEAIGRLAGGVAHDFNNLITGILGITEDLKETFDANDSRRDEVDEVIKASNRAFDVTRQLLAFGRRQIVSPRVLDLNAGIRDFLKLLHRLIGEDIRLDVQLCDLSYIKMDPGNLGQVLLNLTLNARDAMPQGGTVTLRTSHSSFKNSGGQSSHVVLEVSDTGKGMDEEILSHIFEPFFTTKTKDKGTGLGLATVYGIVKQSGGDIVVDSQLNKGTSFRIYLPREINLHVTSDESAPAGQPAQDHEHVLVVEDEPIVRRVVIKRLRNAGYTVFEADDGTQALTFLKEHGASIDLVITDVVMPGMNGREVVENIRRDHPRVSVLYMSGYPEDIITNRGTLEPGINFIEKASIQKDLLNKVREVLRKQPALPLQKPTA